MSDGLVAESTAAVDDDTMFGVIDSITEVSLLDHLRLIPTSVVKLDRPAGSPSPRRSSRAAAPTIAAAGDQPVSSRLDWRGDGR